MIRRANDYATIGVFYTIPESKNGIMEKNYNYTRRRVYLPEYGRHIHEMIDYLGTIEDRAERTRQAQIVIDVMGNLNPLLRDTSDIAHKLWDHLFIMADFNLDVDSPYPIPTRQDLRPRPDKIAYPRKDMMFKHYGKNVERMITSLKGNPDQKAVESTLEDIARYMRTKSYEYNQEHPNNEIIIGDIKRMARGGLTLDEEALGSLKSEYKMPAQPGNTHPKKNNKGGGGKNSKGGQRRGGRAFVMALVALCVGLASCSRDTAHVNGRFIGTAGQPVYLERITPAGSAVVDSVATDTKGAFKFHIELPGGQPTIFNLRYEGSMVPLLVAPGERVSVVSVDDPGRGYRISGSRESELVWQLHQTLTNGAAALDSISALWAAAQPESQRRADLQRAYSRKYYDVKRSQIGFIVENASSLAAVYALYQRLPGDDVLFNGDSDHVYYRMVADSVSNRYPGSRYAEALERTAQEMADGRRLVNRLETEGIDEVDYPEIDLPDMYGKRQRLSELAGKVIVVDFWSAELPASNANNAEMKELWRRFADRGLAVYQVSLDTSRAVWVNAVQEQRLPWTTVCDLRGTATGPLRAWNVGSVPANFVIDRQGNIVAKNLYGEQLYETVSRLTAQN